MIPTSRISSDPIAIITIMGCKFPIAYSFLNDRAISWRWDPETEVDPSVYALVDTLLRTHHTAEIESKIFEYAFYDDMSQTYEPDLNEPPF